MEFAVPMMIRRIRALMMSFMVFIPRFVLLIERYRFFEMSRINSIMVSSLLLKIFGLKVGDFEVSPIRRMLSRRERVLFTGVPRFGQETVFAACSLPIISEEVCISLIILHPFIH